jgi:hypothetical protein
MDDLQQEAHQHRSVTPFLRLEVLDCSMSSAAKGGRRNTCTTDLTVWRPTESQLQELQEGCRFRVFALDVRSKSTGGATGETSLSLGTQKYTQWQCVKGPLPPGMHVAGRACHSIGSLGGVSVGASFDAALLVLRVEPNSKQDNTASRLHFNMFVTDCSGSILVLEMYSSPPSELGSGRRRSGQQLGTLLAEQGSIFSARDIAYCGFDSKCGFHLGRQLSFSLLSARPKQSYLQREVDRLRNWMQEDGLIIAEALQRKLETTIFQ